jgi:hypothetical protein
MSSEIEVSPNRNGLHVLFSDKFVRGKIPKVLCERDLDLEKLFQVLKPYEGNILMVQHFGNSVYARYSKNNASFTGDKEGIPEISLPFVNSIEYEPSPFGKFRINFSNSPFVERSDRNRSHSYFSLPNPEGSIQNFGLVGRILSPSREIIYENTEVISGWNDVYARHCGELEPFYANILVAYGLGRYFESGDDPIST